MAIHQAKIVTITSVKGGVGKTTTTLNLAGTLSGMDKRVLIIDLDLYSGSIAASLNISNDQDVYRLIDDMTNNRFEQIENYIVPYNDLIHVLPSPKDPRYANKVNIKYLNAVINRASVKYDVILIDTTHILNELNLITLDNSDKIIYVLSNDLVDLKNMKTMVSIYKDMQKSNYTIVLNESKDKLKKHFSKYDIKNIIKDNVDYIIPSDFYVRNFDKYVLDGEILILNNRLKSRNKRTVKIFEMICNNILIDEKKQGWDYEKVCWRVWS